MQKVNSQLREDWQSGHTLLPGILPPFDEKTWELVSEVAPIYSLEGKGARFFDSQGRDYIDWVMGWGSCILGHGDEEYVNHLSDSLKKGTLLPCPPDMTVNVARLLCSLIPCAESVYFGKNGSDVCTAAVRLARLHTGRNKIAVCRGHFHGFHDWFAPALGWVGGLPEHSHEGLVYFDYNDLSSVEEAFRKERNQIAAVILEPMRDIYPEEGFLKSLKGLAHGYGALLIYDEIVTGFRLSRGGGQELFDVLPDLACFGKSIAGGLPLSALVGPAELMKKCYATFSSMTYQLERTALSGAEFTLNLFAESGALNKLVETGKELQQRVNDAFEGESIPLQLVGHPSRLTISYTGDNADHSKELITLLIQELMRAGVHTNGSFLPSLAHSSKEVEETIQAIESAVPLLRKGLDHQIRDYIIFPFDII